MNNEINKEINPTVKEMAESVSAEVVTRIGRVVVLFRENPEADPLLSNRVRFGKG